MSLLVSRDCTESCISLNADDGQIYTVAYRNQKTTKLKNENKNPKQKHAIRKEKHVESQNRNTETQTKTKPETQNLNRKKQNYGKLNNKTTKQN